MFRSLEEMHEALESRFRLNADQVLEVLRPPELCSGIMDALARNAVFNENPTIRTHLRRVVRSAARQLGIRSRSLKGLHEHLWGGKFQGQALTVIRLGGPCYDLARCVFRAALAEETAGIVFEKPRSGQSLWEFSALILAAALREAWRGPVFLRSTIGFKAAEQVSSAPELEGLEDAIELSLAAGFRNIEFLLAGERSAGPPWPARIDALLGLLSFMRKQSTGRETTASLRLPGRADPESMPAVLDLLKSLSEQMSSPAGLPALLAAPGALINRADPHLMQSLEECGIRSLSLSGEEEDLNLLPRPQGEAQETRPEIERRRQLPVVEFRPRLGLAERLVTDEEFPADRRREILRWAEATWEGVQPGEPKPAESELLHACEIECMLKFERELWNLDRLRHFNRNFEEDLRRIFRRTGSSGNRQVLEEFFA